MDGSSSPEGQQRLTESGYLDEFVLPESQLPQQQTEQVLEQTPHDTQHYPDPSAPQYHEQQHQQQYEAFAPSLPYRPAPSEPPAYISSEYSAAPQEVPQYAEEILRQHVELPPMNITFPQPPDEFLVSFRPPASQDPARSPRLQPAGLKQRATSLPITALAFLTPTTGEPLLLAGEGSRVHVYVLATGERRCVRKIFTREAVHGIAISPASPTSSSSSDHDTRTIVFWGGARLASMTVSQLLSATESDLPIEIASQHWVFRAGFAKRADGSEVIIAVNAQNQLLVVGETGVLGTVQMGERCLLYSADLLQLPAEDGKDSDSEGRILVAAGTIFGDILVWTASMPIPVTETERNTIPGTPAMAAVPEGDTWTDVASEAEGWEELENSALLSSSGGGKQQRGPELVYRLKGHEGSIFGVGISRQFTLGENHKKRVLASCSDDRTIRVWDISRVDHKYEDNDEDGFDYEAKKLSSWDEVSRIDAGTASTGFGYMAPSITTRSPKWIGVGWGHQARIWNVQVLDAVNEDGSLTVISTSEDLTSKLWKCSLDGQDEELQIIESTMLHSGKNIFSLAVDQKMGLLATGGHDSRVGLVAYGRGGGMQRQDWLPENVVEDLIPEEVREELLPTPPNTDPNGPPPKQKVRKTRTAAEHFKTYAILDSTTFLTITTRGWIGAYTFPTPPRSSFRTGTPGGWKRLGRWENLDGQSSIAAWLDAGLFAAQDASGMVGIMDVRDLLDTIDDGRRRGRWWQAAESVRGASVGQLFCGRHNDIYYLLTTSLVEPEVRLHMFPDPRVSDPGVRNITNAPPPQLRTVVLSPPPGFGIVTSFHVDFDSGILVLGGRTGTLAAFDVVTSAEDADALLNPLGSWREWFDKDAITAVVPYPYQSAECQAPDGKKIRSSRVLATGRNGIYAVLDVSMHEGVARVECTPLHVKKILNGGLLEGAHFRPTALGFDLILHGFKGKHFFVYNETTGFEIMSEECGGAHRAWAFYQPLPAYKSKATSTNIASSPTTSEPSLPVPASGWLVWTQAGTLKTIRPAPGVVINTPPQTSSTSSVSASYALLPSTVSLPARTVLRPGAHGREIKAAAISPVFLKSSSGASYQLLATGAEDTQLRLSTLDEHELGIKTVAVWKKHTTGVLALRWSQDTASINGSSTQTHRLFTSGGVEEFYVWRVTCPLSTEPLSAPEVGVVLEAVCPALSVVPDLRVMSFDVSNIHICESKGGMAYLITTVYSDSSIKVWLYTPTSSTDKFRLLVKGRYTQACLLHAEHVVDHRRSTMHIVVAATDGRIITWDVTALLKASKIFVPPYIGEDKPQFDLVVEQSTLEAPPGPTKILPSVFGAGNGTVVHPVHQSSLKALAVVPIQTPLASYPDHDNGGRALFISGGDDTAVSVTLGRMTRVVHPLPSSSSSSSLVGMMSPGSSMTQSRPATAIASTAVGNSEWKTVTREMAHSSLVTAIAVLSVRRTTERHLQKTIVRFLSASVDQRVAVWETTSVGDEVTLREVTAYPYDLQGSLQSSQHLGVGEERGYTGVADVSGAVAVAESGRVVITGVGMEVWDANV